MTTNNACLGNILTNIISKIMVPSEQGSARHYQTMLAKAYRFIMKYIDAYSVERCRIFIFEAQYVTSFHS